MWWADRRARRRVIVLVISLTWLSWLIGTQNFDVYEAIGTIALIGLAIGVLTTQIVDGSNRLLDALAVLISPRSGAAPAAGA